MKKYIIPIIHLIFAVFMMLIINNKIKADSGFILAIILIYLAFTIVLFIQTILRNKKKT